jgi:uncharacterized membrane protein YeaQ/YmgE (transglycosylase-associated protein family)
MKKQKEAFHMELASIPGINFAIDGLFGWLIVGLIAGFLASAVVRGRGLGCIGNIVVGLVGAVIGGYLASLLGITGNFHFWGTVLISFLGACVLLIILGALTGGRGKSN